MKLFTFIVILCLSIGLISAQTTDIYKTTTEYEDLSNSSIIFDPPELIQVPEGQTVLVSWNTTVKGVYNVSFSLEDPLVGTIDKGSWSIVVLPQSEASDGGITAYGSFNVSALMLGYNDITLTVYDSQGKELYSQVLEMSVVLHYQRLNQIFTTSIGVLLALAYINMGATIDLNLIKQIAKKPIGPLLGIICQYGGMPLIAFGLSYIAFGNDPIFRLGMFMAGCVPGGGASNMWTHLLGGSLDLSIMMTFTSTIAAFALIPAWVLGVGPIIVKGGDFAIPFGDIAIIVVSLIIPCSMGLLVQRYLPRLQRILEMTLTPFSLFTVIYIMTFGIYAYRYIFNFFTVRTVLCGLALPTLGYLLGFLTSTILRQPFKDRIAISIETGVQNGSIAIFMLNFTLPAPAGSLAMVMPAASTLFTPMPLFVAYIIKTIYTRVKGTKSTDLTKDDSKKSQKALSDSVSKKTAPAISTIELGDSTTQNNNPSEGIDNPAVDIRE